MAKRTRKARKKIKVPPGMKVIFRPWIRRGGRIVYAAQYGLRAFPIVVPK